MLNVWATQLALFKHPQCPLKSFNGSKGANGYFESIPIKTFKGIVSRLKDKAIGLCLKGKQERALLTVYSSRRNTV